MSENQVHHERALVGLVLLDPSAIDRTAIELGGYSWIDESCHKLWPILVTMRSAGEPIADTRNVAMRAKSPTIVAEITHLVNDAGMIGQDAYHLGFLTENSERSRLRRIAAEIQNRVANPTDRPEAIQEWIGRELYASTSKTNTKNAGAIMQEVIEQSKRRNPTASVKSGLADLDRCIGGFRPGQLIVLAARPSVGKSALAAQIAIHAAKEASNVLFVSLEMTSQETVSRALAMETSLDMRRILDGDLASHEIHQAEQIANAYKAIPLNMSVSPSSS